MQLHLLCPVLSRALCLQAELLDKIRELLDKRGRGEKLEVFNHEKFPRFRDIVQYFSSEVRLEGTCQWRYTQGPSSLVLLPACCHSSSK